MKLFRTALVSGRWRCIPRLGIDSGPVLGKRDAAGMIPTRRFFAALPSRRRLSPSLNLDGDKKDLPQLSTLNITNHGGQMPNKKVDFIDQNLQDLNDDGVDRRGFLKCMAWAGTGLVWTMSGGIPVSRAFAKGSGHDGGKAGDFSFVQISDSHIGFNKPANPDVVSTLKT